MLWVLTVVILAAAAATHASQPGDGRAAGLLPNCQGSMKEAIISKKTLKHLSMIVLTSNYTLGSGRYNYYQIEQLADDPDIDFRKHTVVYIGGYLSSPFFPYNTGIGQEYKKLGYNVIMLDTLMFNTVEYPRAARFLRVVGKHTAKMLVKLSNKGLDPKRLELVGISLGAQTTSFIAKNYKRLTGASVATLIALDAAGPCFRNLGPADRLDSSDADFVMNIATNIDGFGMAAPVAHVNFYVNGGEHQPGPIYWMYCPDICSHTFAYEVWQSALAHQDEFIGIQCDSVQQARDRECYDRVPRVTNVLSPKTDRNRHGIFYITTINRPPYYMGKKGLMKENDFFLATSSDLNDEDIIRM